MLRQPSDTENKLLLLRAIERLGAVTAEQLLVFMVENEQMQYVPLQLGLAELVDAGLVRKQKHPVGTLYGITGKGRDSLSMFESRLPHSRRVLVDEAAQAWRQRFRREKQQLADYDRRDDGEYVVRLRLLENEQNTLQIELSVPTHDDAERFCSAWGQHASSVYAYLMQTLAGDAAPQDAQQAMPEE